jgi:hypothetical protein
MTKFLFIALSLVPLSYVSIRYISYLAIFFSGFTATVVLNFGNDKGVSIFLFFAIILTSLMLMIKSYSFFVNGILLMNRGQLGMAFFLIAILLSSFMPILIGGAISVPSNLKFVDAFDIPIVFTISSFIKSIPAVLGMCFSLSLVSILRTKKSLYFSIKALLLSISFVTLWGFLQYCSNIFGFEYPSYIFNNIASSTAKGFSQILGQYSESSYSRLSSVTHEPLIFCKYLLLAIPILIFSLLTKQYYFSRRLDGVLLISVCSLIFLSTSSSGIAGLLFSLIFSLYLSTKYRLKSQYYSLLLSTFLFLCLGLFSTIMLVSFRDYLELLIFNKLASGSGVERISSIINAFDYIFYNPSFGIGWHMMTINDLFFYLIVNSGFFGLFTFMYMTYSLIRKCHQNLRTKHIRNDLCSVSMTLGLYVAFICHILLGVVTGVEFYLGIFFVILGLIGSVSVNLNKRTH